LPSIQTKSIHSIFVYKHHVARLQDPTQAEGKRYVQADIVDEAFPVQDLSETQAKVEADTEGEVVGETGRQLGSLLSRREDSPRQALALSILLKHIHPAAHSILELLSLRAGRDVDRLRLRLWLGLGRGSGGRRSDSGRGRFGA
jgi:hypothetical protein